MYATEDNAIVNRSAVLLNSQPNLSFHQSNIDAVAMKQADSMCSTTRENFMGVHVHSSDQPQNQEQQSYSKKQTKRVHFGTTKTVTVPTTDQEDTPMLWYDSSSFEKRRSSDRSLVKKHSSKESPAYHEAVLFLMKSYKPEHRSSKKLLEKIRTLTQTEVRGLEHRIVPLLKVYRSISVKEVLDLQKKLRAEDFGLSETAASLLRQKSVKMSRAGRQLAFRLAQADRLEAKAIYGTNSCIL
jgi:hypothetical protein